MKNNHIAHLLTTMLRGKNGKKSPKLVALVLGLAIGYVLLQPVLKSKFGLELPSLVDPPASTRSQPTVGRSPASPRQARDKATREGEQAILDAFEHRQSDVIVQSTAVVKKNLPDDNVGARHQKCILRLPSGHSVLLAHNLDLADRVPCRVGDELEFYGEYEYTEQGGVIHWTHHDPGQRRRDGWIRHAGKTYQ